MMFRVFYQIQAATKFEKDLNNLNNLNNLNDLKQINQKLLQIIEDKYNQIFINHKAKLNQDQLNQDQLSVKSYDDQINKFNEQKKQILEGNSNQAIKEEEEDFKSKQKDFLKRNIASNIFITHTNIINISEITLTQEQINRFLQLAISQLREKLNEKDIFTYLQSNFKILQNVIFEEYLMKYTDYILLNPLCATKELKKLDIVYIGKNKKTTEKEKEKIKMQQIAEDVENMTKDIISYVKLAITEEQKQAFLTKRIEKKEQQNNNNNNNTINVIISLLLSFLLASCF